MADKRINALTTATSSTSDDFFAIDGTTNGTKKLSAFSPTFGGNVVVTGTLTSQSTLSTSAGLSCQNADITGGYIILRGYGDQNGGLIFLGQSANNNYIQSNATTIGTVIANTGITDVVAAGLRVKTTTASTSTSSGALVVSGGVGVAGAINVGASGLSLFAGNADTSIQIGATAPYQRATVGITRRLNYGDVLFGRNLQGKTSSDNYTTVGTDTSGGGYGGFEVQFGGVARILLGTGNTTQGSDVTPTVALSASTTNATFIGSVTTAAPSGGTAAAWKLGTVASVSPTSPNRTIEVDIGGTIYYIAAKTTNN